MIPHLLHGVMVLVYWLIPHLLHGVMVLVEADVLLVENLHKGCQSPCNFRSTEQ